MPVLPMYSQMQLAGSLRFYGLGAVLTVLKELRHPLSYLLGGSGNIALLIECQSQTPKRI